MHPRSPDPRAGRPAKREGSLRRCRSLDRKSGIAAHHPRGWHRREPQTPRRKQRRRLSSWRPVPTVVAGDPDDRLHRPVGVSRNDSVVTLHDEIVAARCCLVEIDSCPIRLAEDLARLRGSNALVGEACLCESLGTVRRRLSDTGRSCVFCGDGCASRGVRGGRRGGRRPGAARARSHPRDRDGAPARGRRAAGLAEVPVIVRDDLAGGPALAAMVAENRRREDLSPLAAAEAIAELARRGWRQRRIAAETGCGQAHISKRLALLQLPEQARGTLTAGKISVADAQELHKIYGSVPTRRRSQPRDRVAPTPGQRLRSGSYMAANLTSYMAANLTRSEDKASSGQSECPRFQASPGPPSWHPISRAGRPPYPARFPATAASVPAT